MDVATDWPQRLGARPTTTNQLPHSQVDQQADSGDLQAELAARAFALDGVDERPSGISVPGARALVVRDGLPVGPADAFMVGREFAHLHPGPDRSLHMTLPPAVADAACASGWAEPHYLVRTGEIPPTHVMVYAPRDADELEVVWNLLTLSHQFAAGIGQRDVAG